MKTFSLTTCIILLISLTTIQAQQNKAETIKDFLTDAISLDNETMSNTSPIESFNTIAKEKASKSLILTKENMEESLASAAKFKHCVITVGTHTIVKITDLENCIHSGSWGTCMPYGEGYIQKGSLLPYKDYINNIIGMPDSQKRMMFLFE